MKTAQFRAFIKKSLPTARNVLVFSSMLLLAEGINAYGRGPAKPAPKYQNVNVPCELRAEIPPFITNPQKELMLVNEEISFELMLDSAKTYEQKLAVVSKIADRFSELKVFKKNKAWLLELMPKMINGAFFESPDGKIYCIADSPQKFSAYFEEVFRAAKSYSDMYEGIKSSIFDWGVKTNIWDKSQFFSIFESFFEGAKKGI